MPGALGRLGLHADVAGLDAPLLPLLAHPLQSANAALIAGASSSNALPDPGFFLSQFFFKLCPLIGLCFQHRFFALQKRVVITGPVRQMSTIEFDNAGGESAQQHAVVCDEEKRGMLP
jgi:hypothetical protein